MSRPCPASGCHRMLTDAEPGPFCQLDMSKLRYTTWLRLANYGDGTSPGYDAALTQAHAEIRNAVMSR